MIDAWVMILRVLSIAMALAGASSIPATEGSQTDEDRAARTRCLIEQVTHETREDRTRVILRASAPFEYRGGRIMGDQVILDLANAEWQLPSPVVELLAPEVSRVIMGPEITKDGERILKVRLTGVKARTHKVEVKGNELHIDLTVLHGARRPRGLPKIIRNDSEVVT